MSFLVPLWIFGENRVRKKRGLKRTAQKKAEMSYLADGAVLYPIHPETPSQKSDLSELIPPRATPSDDVSHMSTQRTYTSHPSEYFVQHLLQDTCLLQRCLFCLDKAVNALQSKSKLKSDKSDAQSQHDSKRDEVAEVVAIGAIFRVAKVLDSYIEPYYQQNLQHWLFRLCRRYDQQRPTVDACLAQHVAVKEEIKWLLKKSDCEELHRQDIYEIMRRVRQLVNMMRYHEGIIGSILVPEVIRIPKEELSGYDEIVTKGMARSAQFQHALEDIDIAEKRLGIYLGDFIQQMEKPVEEMPPSAREKEFTVMRPVQAPRPLTKSYLDIRKGEQVGDGPSLIPLSPITQVMPSFAPMPQPGGSYTSTKPMHKEHKERNTKKTAKTSILKTEKRTKDSQCPVHGQRHSHDVYPPFLYGPRGKPMYS